MVLVMDSGSLQPFIAGFIAGSLLSGALGFYFGRKISKRMAKPEFRMVLATVIMVIWATAQLFSLAFGTSVDGWLNAIMGGVAGFFFGDGFVEAIKKK